MDDLNGLRSKIDQLDQEIMDLLDKRFDVSIAVGKLKKKINKSIEQTTREQDILSSIHPKKNNRSIEAVYKTILKESKSLQ